MAKHFLDKVSSMSRQTIEAGIITGTDGVPVGRIIIRYTDSKIGWNHEASIWFNDLYNDKAPCTNFMHTVKGDTYDVGNTTFWLLCDKLEATLVHRDWSKNKDEGYKSYDPNRIAAFKSIDYFKIGGKTYRIDWAI